MRSKNAFSAGKPILVIFMAHLLASAIIPTQAQAQKFKVLHTFHGGNGAGPIGQLVRDPAGNLYGTTAGGGTGRCNGGCGTAFKLDKTGKLVWLHSFNGGDGNSPFAGLLRETDGSVYGTTVNGGRKNKTCPLGCGVVFKLDKAGRETVLYKFSGNPDGYYPIGPLVKDTAGNFYGATQLGGTSGLGTVFRVDKKGKETVRYSFTGASDGCAPAGGVIFDAAGNLYGVAFQGGVGFCNSGYGVVYKLDTAGKQTVLHSFDVSDGAYPSSVLLLDSAGNFYGTTQAGGNSIECGGGCGTVFELSPSLDGGWKETLLYSFCSLSNCTDGELPGPGPLVRDASGNLYGATLIGGVYRRCKGDSCGVVFKLDTQEKETVLHNFTGGG
jgi:uncharacterized repeat protein (TIGR03803 family)